MRFVVLCGLLAASTVAAQDVPVRTLGNPIPPAIGPFLEVRGIRELSGDRLIVLDRIDRKLHIVSLRTGASAQLGREGDGPGEYRVPMSMLGLPGDTTLLHDMTHPYEFLVYGPDLKPARSIPIKYRGNSGPPEAVDAQGRFYRVEREVKGLANIAFGKVIRTDSPSKTGDSLAIVNFRSVTPLPPPSQWGVVRPFTTYEQWKAAPDGRVIILHAQPYRVTLVQPDRSVIEGPALPVEPVRVSKEHREEYMEELLAPRVGIYRFFGQTSYVYRPRRDEVEEPNFPEYLPAFLPNALWVASDGMVWVQRTTAFGAPPAFDVLDRSGHRVMRVHLPPGTRLVGFSSGTVLLARLTNQENEILERYRLP